MDILIISINKLKNSPIHQIIDERIAEFTQIKKKPIQDIFVQMCFCIMTANCGAEKCIEIHEKIGNDFLELSISKLKEKFKELGYRYPNIRADYIVNARKKINDLEEVLTNSTNDFDLRDWVVKNIKGLGYKEASHFLRNIGYFNYAIIDFHIIDLLVGNNIIERPKTLTKRKYLEIESILKGLAVKLNLNLAELDLYMWYLETEKVLK